MRGIQPENFLNPISLSNPHALLPQVLMPFEITTYLFLSEIHFPLSRI
jgi:hypothetical protein